MKRKNKIPQTWDFTSVFFALCYVLDIEEKGTSVWHYDSKTISILRAWGHLTGEHRGLRLTEQGRACFEKLNNR